MKIAYFFGAGASVCADMPDTKDMLNWLKEDKNFATLHNSHPFNDIEEVYTYLEDLDKNRLIPLFITKDNNKDFSKYLNDFYPNIRIWRDDYMDRIEKYLMKNLNPSPSTVKYYRLNILPKLQEITPKQKLKIITTNYDLLLDKSFGGNCVDGFELDVKSKSIETWYNKWDRNPSKPTLVKLHGSIDWHSDNNFNSKLMSNHIYKRVSVAYKPMMIPLTKKDKNYNPSPYKELFNQFEQIISEVDLLVVIGYTLRDKKIYDTICKYLNKNLYILLISPNAGKTIHSKFLESNELRINQRCGNVYCESDKNNKVYYCDIKFGDETMDDVVKLIKAMSKPVDSNELIPEDPNIKEFKW